MSNELNKGPDVINPAIHERLIQLLDRTIYVGYIDHGDQTKNIGFVSRDQTESEIVSVFGSPTNVDGLMVDSFPKFAADTVADDIVNGSRNDEKSAFWAVNFAAKAGTTLIQADPVGYSPILQKLVLKEVDSIDDILNREIEEYDRKTRNPLKGIDPRLLSGISGLLGGTAFGFDFLLGYKILTEIRKNISVNFQTQKHIGRRDFLKAVTIAAGAAGSHILSNYFDSLKKALEYSTQIANETPDPFFENFLGRAIHKAVSKEKRELTDQDRDRVKWLTAFVEANEKLAIGFRNACVAEVSTFPRDQILPDYKSSQNPNLVVLLGNEHWLGEKNTIPYYIYHPEERKTTIVEAIQALSTGSIGSVDTKSLLDQLKNSASYKVSPNGDVQKYPFNPLQKIYF